MKPARVIRSVVAISVAGCLVLALEHRGGTEVRFARLLVTDGQLNAQQERATWWGRLWLPLRQWRVRSAYKEFLRENPAHARAMVAYGCFLYDQHREEEAVGWWEKAIAADPHLAVAYNDLGEHYSHSGRAAESLQLFRKACDLAPQGAVFHYNWALICSLYRAEARQVYGWDTEECLRRSLVEFRRARDLAPRDCTFGSAYAQAFYFMANPDWEELRAAWEFCLTQPVDEVERQLIYGRLARVCMHLRRWDDADRWLDQMTAKRAAGFREALKRKMVVLRNGPPEPARFSPASTGTPLPPR